MLHDIICRQEKYMAVGAAGVQTSCTPIIRREVALRLLERGVGLASESGWEATAPCPTPALVRLCSNTKAGPLHSELNLWAAFSLLWELPCALSCQVHRKLQVDRGWHPNERPVDDQALPASFSYAVPCREASAILGHGGVRSAGSCGQEGS